jgi:hypothetical protein
MERRDRLRAAAAFTGRTLFYCSLLGLVITGLIIWITEYYTGTNYRPVRSIAKASETGHGTNVIQGLAISLESTALPTLVIVRRHHHRLPARGPDGHRLCATAMLALAGMVVALDAYGPVTDNAGGIAEMAGLDDSVREKTDALDAVGNTTKAVTKGYAIGSAGLAALVLFAAYTTDLREFFEGCDGRFQPRKPLRHRRPAARRAAALPVRRDGHDRGGPRGGRRGQGRARPVRQQPGHHGRQVQARLCPHRRPRHQGGDQGNDHPLAAAGAGADRGLLRDHRVAGQANGFAALGALLLGVIVGGLFVAISMTSGGGAWDNAKKYIEDGNHGGKGSEAHKAAVTGDTVGDPYKDTAGPAVNPMIKITNIVALLLLAALQCCGAGGWIEQFLELEHSGWKGMAGSAMICAAETEALFRTALEHAASSGKLERLTLRIDSQPIAMLANFITPPGSFSYKTAFAESYARFSPGVLLQRENLALLDRNDIGWCDSCAAPDHPMIDSLWTERRAIGRISVAIGGRGRRSIFNLLNAIELGRNPVGLKQ